MKLVSMEDSEISHSDREILIRSLGQSKHHAMAWAVHWLQTVLLSFTFNPEDILLIFEVVAGNFPKLRAIHVGADYFIVSSDLVFASH